MECICERKVQLRVKGEKRPIWYEPGDVEDFEECPKFFSTMKGRVIDFATAGKQELDQCNFELPDLKAFIEKQYDLKPGNRGMAKTIEMLMDARERHVGAIDKVI